MRKHIVAVVTVLSVICLLSVSCNDEPKHVHSFIMSKYDSTTHWMECQCGEKDPASVVAHSTTVKSDGSDHWYVCAVCGYSSAREGHEVVVDSAVEATCTGSGLTEGSHCSVCGNVIAAQEELEAKGHSWNGGEITAEPSCTQKGVMTYTCTVCGETRDEDIDVLGHVEIADEAVAPTCTSTGLSEGSHCSVCEMVLVAQETIPALGHTVVTDIGYEATCTDDGLSDGSHCSVCHEILKEQRIIPATGHAAVTDKAVAPTCTEDGWTEGEHCSICNEVFLVQERVPATGHTIVTDEWVSVTCISDGLTIGRHCAVCGAVLLAQRTIHSQGTEHRLSDAYTDSTTHEGTCSFCGKLILDNHDIGYNFNDERHTFKCIICGYTGKLEPHIFIEVHDAKNTGRSAVSANMWTAVR